MVETLDNYDLNNEYTRLDILGKLPKPDSEKKKTSKDNIQSQKKEKLSKKRKREEKPTKKKLFGIVEEVKKQSSTEVVLEENKIERKNKRQRLENQESSVAIESNERVNQLEENKENQANKQSKITKKNLSEQKDQKEQKDIKEKIDSDFMQVDQSTESKTQKKKSKKQKKENNNSKNLNNDKMDDVESNEKLNNSENKKMPKRKDRSNQQQASKMLGSHLATKEQLKSFNELEQVVQAQDTIEGEVNNEKTKEEQVRENWSALGLPDTIVDRIINMGFVEPTNVQKQSIPTALIKRKNVIIASQTGSGKTMAFALPIISRLLTENNPIRKVLRALIIVPSRELCIQVNNMIKDACFDTGIYTEIAVGGFFVDKNLKRVGKRCPEILVCTPARLWALIHTHRMSHLMDLSNLNFLVFDEADIMVKNGHYKELDHILKHITHLEDHQKLQKFLTSATMTLPSRWSHERANIVDPNDDWEKDAEKDNLSLKKLMESMHFNESSTELIDLTPQSAVADTLIDTQITCKSTQKRDYLYYLLYFYKGRSIVFCNSVYSVQEIFQLMKLLKIKIYQLHGGMTESQRLNSLEKFLKHDDATLVATDAVARGIDIPQVTQVIHYELPTSADTYIHRCGRSGRAFNTGFSVAFVTEKDKRSYKIICGATKRKEGLPLFPTKDYFLRDIQGRTKIAWQLVLKEKDRLKKSHEVNWYQKLADEMDILLDEEEFSDIFEKKKELKHDRSRDILEKQLAQEMKKTIGESRFAGQRDFITAETTDFSFLKPKSRDARSDFFTVYLTVHKIDEERKKKENKMDSEDMQDE